MSEQKDLSQGATDSAAKGTENTSATSETAGKPEAKAETGGSSHARAAAGSGPTIDATPRSFPIAPYKPTVQYRFALLAASVAVAAALGGLIGSVSTFSFASPKTETATTPDATHKLQIALAQMSKEVGSLKASIDASNRNATAQAAKINERLDRSEKAQAEPAQKLAALTETVARLEKRLASNDNITTGSVQRAASTVPKDESKPQVVQGWVLREIYRGRALVENRHAIYEVGPGGVLPGIGRVESITKQDGRWVVVTPKGLIVSMR
jgi:hypothetical protein